MNSFSLSALKYLVKYASANCQIEAADLSRIKNIVVIPAIDELENIKILILSLTECENKYFASTLFLFVINNTVISKETVKRNNELSLLFLRNLIFKKSDDHFSHLITKNGLRLAVIDASSPGKEMPGKDGGVGFARKIGMDLSLTVFDFNNSAKNILICLDADCTVSKNYLTAIVDDFNCRKLNAASIYFEHKLTQMKETTQAIICYELFLRYYVLGLRYSNSYFAFHTIGSSMACTAESYIKIEGMNKQKAAEDFYFLEKLAKNYPVETINRAVVFPSARPSWRVPFGTGQRVNRFIAHTHDEYSLYSPECFEALKKWHVLFFTGTNINAAEYLSLSKKINIELWNFLISNNFQTVLDKIFANSKSLGQINLQKLKWFDGFKTLKLIHHLRDKAFPNKNMFDALDELFLKLNINLVPRNENETVPPIEIQTKYLNELRKFDKENDYKN